MSWEAKITETIEATAPYAFGKTKVTDKEEMDNVCRYVVQQVEDQLVSVAKYMHWQGVLAGLEAAGGDTSELELDQSLDGHYAESKFREWERLQKAKNGDE